MASFAHSKLTRLQREVLDGFFERERGFFLTGGAALAGFYLGHRTTDDLDLFTAQDLAFERGRYVLADVATAVGGSLQVRQDAATAPITSAVSPQPAWAASRSTTAGTGVRSPKARSASHAVAAIAAPAATTTRTARYIR